LRLYFF